MRRRTGALAAWVLAVAVSVGLAPRAAADNVNVGGIPYNSVTIRDVSGGTITFLVQLTGVEVIKRFSDVRQIEVTGNARFNKAEKDFAAGEYEAALDGYRQTVTTAIKTWLKTVAEIRLITCYQHAGRLGEAVDLYFKYFKASPGAVTGVKLERIGPAGSAGNKAALAKLRALAASESGAVLAKVNEVLKAVEAVENPGGPTVGDDDDDGPGPGPSVTDPAPAAGAVKRELSRIASLVDQKKGSMALEAIDKLRKSGAADSAATAGELHFQEGMARKLRGDALRRSADAATSAGEHAEARRLKAEASAEFLRAGYSLLRLPLTRSLANLPKAPRALHEVGVLYRDNLSRKEMARKCFEMVRSRYPASPWSRAASDALRTLE